MNKHLLASATALLLYTIAFSQNIAWHRVTGGFIDFGLVADSFDHVRMLNSFSGTHDFDPGPGESLISVQVLYCIRTAATAPSAGPGCTADPT